MLTEEQLKCLSEAVREVGGPYWHRVLEMHGSGGTRSEVLAGLAPHHLWLATAQQFSALMDAGLPLPAWVQLGAKAMYGEQNALREKEVIEASVEAGGWREEEDKALFSLLEEFRAPEWTKIADRMNALSFQRSAEEVERRAVVLHRYHTYFSPLSVPHALSFLRTADRNSFGLPRNPDWSELEDAKLLEGLQKVRGSHWHRILMLYGAAGSVGSELCSKTEIDLARRAREWWAAFNSDSSKLSSSVQEVIPFITAKGYSVSGLPTSRGWNDELDQLLLSELSELRAPNYNDILARHGAQGSVSQRLAPKTYSQLRLRALKLYEHCVREHKPLPPGLQYAKPKRAKRP